jgi:hypothetical protein
VGNQIQGQIVFPSNGNDLVEWYSELVLDDFTFPVFKILDDSLDLLVTCPVFPTRSFL